MITKVPENEKPPRRSAGILLHITSLPSKFGIGDLGPEARKFAEFLQKGRQHYWQVLPVNPTAAEQGYSPYSSVSSMAGNILLVSPEQLVNDGLLSSRDANRYKSVPSEKVNWRAAHDSRLSLLSLAYRNFNNKKKAHRNFLQFCQRENEWLNDFALFVVIKQQHQNKTWFTWPDMYKNRDPNALSAFYRDNAEAIRFVKWQQFIFFHQWSQLKLYCNQLKVQILGDLPFYVSYDSADVWAHRKIFNISNDGLMTGVAGVPPDYFNSNGQLWGMPTFKWNVLKQTGYNWWAQRIRKNMELFDLLRLDHFRAFADYWEVPSHHATAKHGKWKPGPGHQFLDQMRRILKQLPFIAEDLGDINEAVYALRDDFNLPGMKVLQFAFGTTMPTSDYIPHNFSSNFVVYTGTHDNNTTRGWYANNISNKERRQLDNYVGKVVTEQNVSRELSRLAYSSVAKTVILPMQDVLGLGEKARMNTPASTDNNWQWRLKPKTLTRKIEKELANWVLLYNRSVKV
jgi:4-alpha-glucanotransferase